MAAFVKETRSPVRTAALRRCPGGGTRPEKEIKTLPVLDGEGERRRDEQPPVMLRNDDGDRVVSARSLLGFARQLVAAPLLMSAEGSSSH